MQVAVRDVSALNELRRYDLITAFDAFHDQARAADVLRGAAVALTPDGTFLMQDTGRRAISTRTSPIRLLPSCIAPRPCTV